MINTAGELTTSIPSICINYNPILNESTKVKCEHLGHLYKCKNHSEKTTGCLFCKNFVKWKI